MELHREIKTDNNNTQNLHITEDVAYDLLLPVDFKPKYALSPGSLDDPVHVTGENAAKIRESSNDPKVTITSANQINVQDLHLSVPVDVPQLMEAHDRDFQYQYFLSDRKGF